MRMAALLVMLGMVAGAQAQLPPMPMPDAGLSSGAKLPAWDVVSVKVNKVGDGRMSWSSTPDGMHIIGVPIMNLLFSAYGLFGSPEEEITGLPKWAETTRFDVEAKVAPEDVARYEKLTSHESELLLQELLVERFAMKATPVTNERAVYGLVVAKSGPKMVAHDKALGEDGKPLHPMRTEARRGVLKVEGGTMDGLAGMLTDDVGKVVVDKTGLRGTFDFELTWTPDEVADAGVENGKAPAPPLFTAIQEELGLKLEPMRGPVKGLVVERLEMPTAN